MSRSFRTGEKSLKKSCLGNRKEFFFMYYYFLHLKWETATEGKSESRGTGKTKVGKDLFILAQ